MAWLLCLPVGQASSLASSCRSTLFWLPGLRRVFRRGTNGSNPFSSTSESGANLIGGSRATSRLESGRTITAVSGAVLENVRFAIDGEDHRAFVGVGLVERPDPSPDE